MLFVWGEEELYGEFWRRKLRESDHFQSPGAGRKILLKWIFKKETGWNGVGRINLAEKMDIHTYTYKYFTFIGYKAY